MTMPTHIERLDEISRTRALTHAESMVLERFYANRPRRHRQGNMIPGFNATPEPALLGNYETAWRADCEAADRCFVEALELYFARGGTA